MIEYTRYACGCSNRDGLCEYHWLPDETKCDRCEHAKSMHEPEDGRYCEGEDCNCAEFKYDY